MFSIRRRIRIRFSVLTSLRPLRYLSINDPVPLSRKSLSDGNVTINGDVVDSEEGRAESHVAFYTSGNVNWNGTRTVTGQIFAGQNVNLGDGQFDGNVATRAGVNFNGQPQMTYRPASAALTKPVWN